jgi:hypothetical protein
MNNFIGLTDAFSFLSAPLFLLAVPLVLLLLRELNHGRKSSFVALTDLEYLRNSGCMTGEYRHVLRVLLWLIVVLILGLIWAGPMLHSAAPVFSTGHQSLQKELIVAIDISRSMGQPIKVPDKEERLANYGMNRGSGDQTDTQQSRYESARQTFYNFVDRFEGARIGLILFTTEPFLARWPTTETEDHFMEVLEEKIGQGERSQLQRFSSLTNIDKALKMTREIFSSQKNIRGGTVILISDAEDELENMGLAIRALRSKGIRLYTIGVGISEVIVENLSAEFNADPGFRIFHVDSEQEMKEAYDLVSELEESPRYATEELEFVTELRWLLAMLLVFVGAVVIWLTESMFHQSWISERDHRTGTR